MSALFPPTPQAALARLDQVDPAAYAASRNALDGAVTRLSPYLCHGLLSVPQAAQALQARHGLPAGHKLLQELGWREFFQHVWRHRGDGILLPLHPGPRPMADYQPALPDDIRQGRTGVPVIDRAVRTLYADGWLHNHARLWLASYVVHVRGVHWRAGADWLLGHLLDGDLASNHLSWQWVAGTGSHQPYLFNADNVARFCGGLPGWASPGSVVDTGYDTLSDWAHGLRPLPPAPLSGLPGVAEPALLDRPPADLLPPAPPPLPQALAGRRVWLVHPWALGEPPEGRPTGLAGDAPLRLGVWPAESAGRWRWSAERWRFVARRMDQLTGQVLWADSATLAHLLGGAAQVLCLDNAHLPAAWPASWRLPAARHWPDPDTLQGSFSQFWRQAMGRQGAGPLSDRR